MDIELLGKSWKNHGKNLPLNGLLRHLVARRVARLFCDSGLACTNAGATRVFRFVFGAFVLSLLLGPAVTVFAGDTTYLPPRFNHWYNPTRDTSASDSLKALETFMAADSSTGPVQMGNLKAEQGLGRVAVTMQNQVFDMESADSLQDMTWRQLRSNLFNLCGVTNGSGHDFKTRLQVRWLLVNDIASVLSTLSTAESALIEQASKQTAFANAVRTNSGYILATNQGVAVWVPGPEVLQTLSTNKANLQLLIQELWGAVAAAGQQQLTNAALSQQGTVLQQRIAQTVQSSRDPVSASALAAAIGTGLDDKSLASLTNFLLTLDAALTNSYSADNTNSALAVLTNSLVDEAFKPLYAQSSQFVRLADSIRMFCQIFTTTLTNDLDVGPETSGTPVLHFLIDNISTYSSNVDDPDVTVTGTQGPTTNLAAFVEELSNTSLNQNSARAETQTYNHTNAMVNLKTFGTFRNWRATYDFVPQGTNLNLLSTGPKRTPGKSIKTDSITNNPLYLGLWSETNINALITSNSSFVIQFFTYFSERGNFTNLTSLTKLESGIVISNLAHYGFPASIGLSTIQKYATPRGVTNLDFILATLKMQFPGFSTFLTKTNPIGAAAFTNISQALFDVQNQQTAANARYRQFIASLDQLQLDILNENQRHFDAMGAIAQREILRWTNMLSIYDRYDHIYKGSYTTNLPQHLATVRLFDAKTNATSESYGPGIKELAIYKSDDRNTKVLTSAGATKADLLPPRITHDSLVLASMRLLAENAHNWQVAPPGANDPYGYYTRASNFRLVQAVHLANAYLLMGAFNNLLAEENGLNMDLELREHGILLDGYLRRSDEEIILLDLQNLAAFHATGITGKDVDTVANLVESGLLTWIGAKVK